MKKSTNKTEEEMVSVVQFDGSKVRGQRKYKKLNGCKQ